MGMSRCVLSFGLGVLAGAYVLEHRDRLQKYRAAAAQCLQSMQERTNRAVSGLRDRMPK